MEPFLQKGPCLTSSHTTLRVTSVSVLLAGNTCRMGSSVPFCLCVGNGVAEMSREEKKKNAQLPMVVLHGSDSTVSPWISEIKFPFLFFPLVNST